MEVCRQCAEFDGYRRTSRVCEMRILFATFGFCSTVSLLLFFVAGLRGPGDCDGRALLRCSRAPAQLENLTSAVGELEMFCGSLDWHRHCVDIYTRSCLTPRSRALFYRLYGATNRVLETVCGEELPRQEFASHAECYERLRRELEKLTREFRHGVPRMSRGDGNSAATGRVCDAARRFVRSLQELVLEECEESSAQYVRALLHEMSENVISVCRHSDTLYSASSAVLTYAAVSVGTTCVLLTTATLQSEQVYNTL